MRKIHIFCLIIFLFVISLIQPIVFSKEPGSDLPTSFDWRDVGGIDYSTPVKNQAPAPTCEAYALCAALETILQYNRQEVFYPDLSETHLYFYAGGTYNAGYVNIVDASNYLIEQGVPDEGCFPDPHRPFDYPFESLPDWPERTVKITEWGWVERTNEAIKEALIDHGPLAACFNLYKDFDFYRAGVYKHKWGTIDKGHVMTIFGYDDMENCWIIKNSAGPDWGEDGWLRMDYESTMFAEWYGEDTGIMYIDGAIGNDQPDVPRVYIESPRIFHSYIFGQELPQLFRSISTIQKGAPRLIGPIQIEVSAENTQRVEFYVDDELTQSTNVPPYELTLDYSYGVHTVKVIAYDGDGDKSMDILDVFVIL